MAMKRCGVIGRDEIAQTRAELGEIVEALPDKR